MDNNNIRRSVLFLLNGFGMDRKDIYDIINDDTASYINQIAQTGLFGSLENINSNFKGGFRTFSTSERSLPGYKRLQKDLDENFVNNPKALEMINKIKSRGGKAHLFVSLENQTTIDQAKAFIKYFLANGIKNICIHLIFTTIKGITYKELEKSISDIKIVTFQNPTVKLGVFVGSEIIENNNDDTKELYRLLTTEIGERWPDFIRKIDLLKQRKTKPGEVKPFFMGNGFKVVDTDTVVFLNYDFVDYSLFIDVLKHPTDHFALSNLPCNVEAISLFPIKANILIDSFYDVEVAKNYLVKYMEEMHTKALVITTVDRITYINNYFNGFQNVKSEYLDFMILDDNLPIPNVVTNPNYQLIIFDFDLGKCKDIEELKAEIKRANSMLGNVYDACRKYDYTLTFTSLYGIEREWKRDNTQVYNINYMAEVPFVVSDRLIIRGKHFLKAGSNAFILPTVCALMDPTKNYSSLVTIKQSGGILSQFGIK